MSHTLIKTLRRIGLSSSHKGTWVCRDEKSQLMLGIRRANRQTPTLSSSVISSDSMHIGILAAAAHANANSSPFTIFFNPRASPSEFVVPLAKYNKALYAQVSLGMRFRMMFETEDCGVRRYMGTVTGISDLDPVRWKGSQWRNLQVMTYPSYAKLFMMVISSESFVHGLNR